MLPTIGRPSYSLKLETVHPRSGPTKQRRALLGRVSRCMSLVRIPERNVGARLIVDRKVASNMQRSGPNDSMAVSISGPTSSAARRSPAEPVGDASRIQTSACLSRQSSRLRSPPTPTHAYIAAKARTLQQPFRDRSRY